MTNNEAFDRACSAVWKADKKNQFADLSSHEILMVIKSELAREFKAQSTTA